AEAEAEGESRMAAIMGRKVEPAKPIEPEPVAEIEAAPVEEVPEWLSHVSSTTVIEPAASTPVEELPEWLRGLRPTEDAVTTELAAEPVAEITSLPEGDISPDDALAFFARLSAGKEDQLRAEAEAEGESRMAAIMGRKVEPAKPIEPEPIVASVAEVATPEPSVPEAVAPEATALEAAAILEGDISPDDALAFFARLSAGKEDQLRAEAEAEGESRMAAIMGRKVEPAKPIEPEPMLEASLEEVPVVMEEVPDWVSQLGSTVAVDVVAGDTVAVDTVAPIASDELPDWLLALRPSDEALAAEPVPDIEPVLVDELPAWLQAMQPSAPETPAAGDASTDAPIHEAVTIEPTLMEVTVSDTFDVEPTSTHDLPEWLRDMQPSASAAEPTPSDSLPDWLRAIQPESIEVVDERAVAEVEPEPVSDAVIETVGVSEVEAIAEPTPAPIAEAVSAAPAAKAPIGPVSWWTQSAQDEGEEPISELPAAVKPTTSTVRLAPAALSAPASRMTRERTLEPSGRETRRRYTRSTEKRRAEVEPVPALNSVNIDPLVTQLESDKYNHAVRLELARAWWSMGNRDSALDEYAKLINPARVENLSDEELDERDFAEAGPLADDIIADLERIVEIDEHAAWP
ncbi:MAG TPA: hypothetical protein VFF59_06225, partial [Anaerolineae bacterium]|nr:hypothetical protein [Anaerolineae bacterium]